MGWLRRWNLLARLEYRERDRLSYTAHLMTVFRGKVMGLVGFLSLLGDVRRGLRSGIARPTDGVCRI